MNEEEKKAIKRTKKILYMFPETHDLKTIIDLVDKQQKEIEDLKENYEGLSLDLGKALKELGLPEDTIIADELVLEINEKYISKDKIREVLEKERKKQKERVDISLALHSQYISLIDKIKKQIFEEE